MMAIESRSLWRIVSPDRKPLPALASLTGMATSSIQNPKHSHELESPVQRSIGAVWDFFGGREGWSWRALDAATGSVLRQSHRAFTTLFESIKDAELKGYCSSKDQQRVLRLA
jgi:hypothetical protein